MIRYKSLQGNLLQNYYVDILRQLNRERNARIDALRTREDAETYIMEVREKIARSFQPMPERGTPPQYQSTGKHDHGKYTLENLIYFSRPGFPVTANLYMPKAGGKVPAVLFLCGHGSGGKATEAYAIGAASLAEQGYAVLIPDPAAQGERLLFADIPPVEGVSGNCCNEHNMVGKQLMLCGEFFGSWRAYDAIRGLDLLLSLPQVDPACVGVTGNSGGGTMTAFVQAIEPRFTMAAPSCYITSWQHNAENELPCDAEQMIPGLLAAGCEMGDLLLAYAPRPILVLGQKNDFFDPRGTIATSEQVRKVYALLGCEENLQYFIGGGSHGYSAENRNAMYRFFQQHSPVAEIPEKEAEMPPADELRCTASGQLADSMPEAATIHSIANQIGAKMIAGRQKLAPRELKEKVREMLALPEQIGEPYFRVLRDCRCGKENMMFARFAVESEENCFAVLKLLSSKYYCHIPPFEEITLYIAHADAAAEAMEICDPDSEIAALDVRGVGESLPAGCDLGDENHSYLAHYSSEYHYQSLELMLGRTMAGRRVLDILAAVKLLKARGVKKIKLRARGLGTIPAAFAALLCGDIDEVSLQGAAISYASMLADRVTFYPASVMIPGILAVTDLPEIYDAIAAEKPLHITYAQNPQEND